MKCIILCAGYATRLYPLTLNKPKALLPINNKPLLDYILEKIELIAEINDVFIVTNDKFYNHFVNWSKEIQTSKTIKIINDFTNTNETRLGGLGDLGFVINKEKIDDNLLVIAGDNLFNFDLQNFVNYFNKQKRNTIGLYDIKDLDKSKNFGILEIDESNRIISFEEKPDNPKCSLISTALYMYTKEELNKIKEYLNTSLSKEGPGYLIPYFLESQDVYGFLVEGDWWDIGTKDTYEEVVRKFNSSSNL